MKNHDKSLKCDEKAVGIIIIYTVITITSKMFNKKPLSVHVSTFKFKRTLLFIINAKNAKIVFWFTHRKCTTLNKWTVQSSRGKSIQVR